jgi:hypothetical protein
MISPVRGVGGFPVTALTLALGIWGASGCPAFAQGGRAVAGNARGEASAGGLPAYGGTTYGAAGAYGVPSGGAGSFVPVYGATGIFGPGYPGYGLEYCPKDACRSIHRHVRQGSIHNWGAYVLGRECMYPYVADPYSDPKGALVPWPPYSAPAASVPTYGPSN